MAASSSVPRAILIADRLVERLKSLKMRMYPPDQERRDLPEDIPSKKALADMLNRVEQMRKSTKKVVKRKKGQETSFSMPVRVTNKAMLFFQLPTPIYDRFLMMKVLNLYIFYYSLGHGPQFDTDDALEALIGQGPHTFIDINALLVPLYVKKIVKPITDKEIESSSGFLDKERAEIQNIFQLKKAYLAAKAEKEEMEAVTTGTGKKNKGMGENRESKLLSRKLKLLADREIETWNAFIDKASVYRLFREVADE